MIVVLAGAPGAGKGTQADLLAERCGFRKVSTGDALRKHVKMRTPIGQRAEAIMARGELVPDEVLFQILKEELGSKHEERILLDGYPRNVPQAQTLDTLKDIHSVTAALHLDVNNQVLVERLSGRRVCGSCGASFHITATPPKVADKCDRCGNALVQRPDDQASSVTVRLSVYETNTKPVLDFYRQRALYRRIDGVGTGEEVFGRLKDAVESL